MARKRKRKPSKRPPGQQKGTNFYGKRLKKLDKRGWVWLWGNRNGNSQKWHYFDGYRSLCYLHRLFGEPVYGDPAGIEPDQMCPKCQKALTEQQPDGGGR